MGLTIRPGMKNKSGLDPIYGWSLEAVQVNHPKGKPI
jgi:hypothetical protein